MPVEIERKFLVRGGDAWRARALRATPLLQGYVSRGPGATVRVRLVGAGTAEEAAFLTLKSAGAGAVRAEFEYPLPPEHARAMIAAGLCRDGRLVEKTRHDVPHAGLVWQVDVFAGHLAGLVLAEVELPSPDHPVVLPPWAGEEVTDDPRYGNSALSLADAPPDATPTLFRRRA